MGFIDSYKQLEKICGEMLNDDRRLTAYIDEMINTPNGNRYVHSWDDDLKMLKHYRWIRNRIVHDPGCNELNMCEPGDELWLDNFYSRIIKGTDPLSMYRKACSRKQNLYEYSEKTIVIHQQPKQELNYFGIIMWIILILLMILLGISK